MGIIKSKKILIITHGFYPEISPRSFRATELAKEFSRQGHVVTVMAPKRKGLDEFINKYSIDFIDLGEVTWKVPQTRLVNRIGTLFNRVNVRFADLFFAYPSIQLKYSVSKKLINEKGFDLLISIAVPYPIHWGVASIWNKEQKIAKVWVADCGDPYMGQENDTFKPPFYFGWVEKWFCRKADYITVPTENSIHGYYPEFHSKIRVIPQGFRFEDVILNEGALTENIVIFGYAGMFIPGRRDPSEFLGYLNSLDEKIIFEFHIYTSTPNLVLPFINKSKGRIVLKDFVPREQLLYELSKMHFVVNFENVGKTQTPSKLIDYLIINKPVMSIRFGQLNTSVVNDFLKGNYVHKMDLPPKEKYRIENVCEQFLSIEK